MDQILPCPADPQIHESYLKSADDYVRLAERANGPIERPVSFDYVRGDALAEIECRRRDARIITSGTVPEPKGIDCCVLANNHLLDWCRLPAWRQGGP